MSPRLNGDFVGGEIARVPPSGPRLLGRLDLWGNCADDSLCQLPLQFKDVFQHTVIALRPNMIAGQRVDQLAGDTYPIGRLPYAAFQHVADAKFLADLLDVGRFALVGERRVPSDYEERMKAR